MSRFCMLILAFIAITVLEACATTEQAVVRVPTREESLLSMGFEKSDEGYVFNIAGPLLFESGSDVLMNEANKNIIVIAQRLKELNIVSLRLFGHTDDVGSADTNKALSLKRAEAVAQSFIANGFDDAKIERRGFGLEKPITSNETYEGRRRNRRVAVIVPLY